MSTRRALALSFIDRYASHLLAVVSVVILSRLLTPREIGLFAIPMVFIALLSSLRDFGAGQYLVQERDLTPDRIRAVWTVQLGLGLGLTLVIALASAPVSAYFGEPEIRPLMLILALNFAVTPFGSVTYAWLSRCMRFGALTIMRLSGALATAATGILLAYLDYGAISLAWANLAGAVATAIVASAFRPRHFPWLPGLRAFTRVMAFGTRAVIFTVTNTLGREAPLFFLGKLQDAATAGFYSRAFGMLRLFELFVMQAVHAVTLPALSRLERENTAIEPLVLRAMSYLCVLGWTFLLGAALLADPLVRLLYGNQWLESVDLVRILALAIALIVPLHLCTQILVSKGLIHVNVRIAAVSNMLFVLALAWTARLGAAAAAWTTVVASGLMMLIWAYACHSVMTLSLRALAAHVLQSLIVALIANIGPALVVWHWGLAPESIALALGCAIPSGLLGFMVGLQLTRHPMKDEAVHVIAWTRRLLGRTT